MSRYKEIKLLITENNRYLQKLKQQQAKFGLYAPPHILIEIEDKEEEIAELYSQLEMLENCEEEPVLYQNKVSQLDWDTLQNVCRNLNKDFMGASQVKYRKELYLQREIILHSFNEFLRSEKTCFVLTGKSGVGKTSFLLSLVDYFQHEDHLCFLGQNGAFLQIAQDIEIQITEQLNQRLKFQTQSEHIQIESFLWEINRISKNRNFRFVLIIDAINENSQPAYLLKNIDRMVRSVGMEQIWFKVVISTRPEAWRQMYRLVKPLTENRYYHLRDREQAEIESPEFQIVSPIDQASNLTNKITTFGKDEVKAAYDIYEKGFNLISKYENLSPIVQRELRDPLIMRLLAEIHAGDSIPQSISISDIYRNYIKALILSGRLEPNDGNFLQTIIIPLMAEDGYNNEITSSQVESSGIWLPFLNREGKDSDGAAQQSFKNLIDADILTLHVAELDYVIRFSFERFYDYYFGQYLSKQIAEADNLTWKYQELIEQITAKPFLWGPVKNTLLSEINRNNIELIQELSGVSNQLSQVLLMHTLIEYSNYGQKQLQFVQKLTDIFLRNYDNNRSFLPIFNIMLRTRFSASRTVNYDRTVLALEVARHLELIDVLVWASIELPEMFRVLAMQHVYHLWRKNPTKGYYALQAIATRLKLIFFIPRIAALQSCLGISLLILSEYRIQEEENMKEALNTLGDIWKRIIEELLLESSSRRGLSFFKAILRTIILRAIIGFVIRLVSVTSKERPYIKLISLFFQASEETHQRYKQLTDFIEKPIQDFEEVRKMLYGAVDDNDSLTGAVTNVLFVCQFELLSSDNKCRLLELISEVFNYSLSKPTAGLITTNLLIATEQIGLNQTEIDDDVYHLNEQMAISYLNKTRGIFYSELGFPQSNALLGGHCMMRKARQKSADTNLHKKYIRLAIDEEDWSFFELIMNDLTFAATAYQAPEHTLEALSTVLSELNNSHPIVAATLIDLLTRMYVFFPELIEDFIERHRIDEYVAQQIKRRKIEEHPWADILLPRSAIVFGRFLQFSETRTLISSIFRNALTCRNPEEFTEMLIKQLINFIYGQPIFFEGK